MTRRVDTRSSSLTRGRGLPGGVRPPPWASGRSPIAAASWTSVPQDPRVALERLRPAPGYEVNLFASEEQFPEIAKPVAMTFDARGRLWVLTSPTYPHLAPGKTPADKLVILEDTNTDGRADKSTVFADQLHLPMGFELGDGGVYVSQEPNLMFLRDTNGDDRADERRVILHGFGTEDSHHAIHAFQWGPGGDLYFQEGTFLHSQVETPHGPVRVENAAVFRYLPKAERLEVFVSYPFANPWGHVVDSWGQHFISDASGGANYYGTPFSGHVDYPRKQRPMKEWTLTKVRPTGNIEFIRSRHFPDDVQGHFVINNVIGFHGTKQYRVVEDGSGFTGIEVEPLLQSTDPNFRPVAMQMGPDGALYIGDWFNPLIGHMQYSLRDPRRDVQHGRIWRVTAKGRPLVPRPKIHGQAIPALLENLKAYEDRTRYWTRRELRERPTDQVVAALGTWVAGLDTTEADYEHRLLEALWVYEHHDSRPGGSAAPAALGERVPRPCRRRPRAAALVGSGEGRHGADGEGRQRPVAARAAGGGAVAELHPDRRGHRRRARRPEAHDRLLHPVHAGLDDHHAGEGLEAGADGRAPDLGRPSRGAGLSAGAAVARRADTAATQRAGAPRVAQSARCRAPVSRRGAGGAVGLGLRPPAVADASCSPPSARIDGRPGSGGVAQDLGALLLARDAAAPQPLRHELERLASDGRTDTARRAAWAALVKADGSRHGVATRVDVDATPHRPHRRHGRPGRPGPEAGALPARVVAAHDARSRDACRPSTAATSGSCCPAGNARWGWQRSRCSAAA